MSQATITELVNEFQALAERIATAAETESPRMAKRVRTALEQVSKEIAATATRLDPIRKPSSIFDPADPATAGRIIALTMVAQPRHRLANIPKFYGAGIYAIYYNGKFPTYQTLSQTEHPLYVGKADPSNPRATNAQEQGDKLSTRLNEHAKAIKKAASTLVIDDFDCRFLVVQSGFQTAAENYLIDFFKPIWNSETKICFGLGKHGDSASTRGNKRSPWDTLHPGRDWADATKSDQKSTEVIEKHIASHLLGNPPSRSVEEIFKKFLHDMQQLRIE